MVEPELLRAEEVAKILGVGRSKVFEMFRAGELPVIRLGRSVRVPRAALAEWISQHTVLVQLDGGCVLQSRKWGAA